MSEPRVTAQDVSAALVTVHGDGEWSPLGPSALLTLGSQRFLVTVMEVTTELSDRLAEPEPEQCRWHLRIGDRSYRCRLPEHDGGKHQGDDGHGGEVEWSGWVSGAWSSYRPEPEPDATEMGAALSGWDRSEFDEWRRSREAKHPSEVLGWKPEP